MQTVCLLFSAFYFKELQNNNDTAVKMLTSIDALHLVLAHLLHQSGTT